MAAGRRRRRRRPSTGVDDGWSGCGCRSSRSREHIVDFDEAFVRVIERHRAERRRRSRGSGADGARRRTQSGGTLMSIRRRRIARRERRDLAAPGQAAKLRQGTTTCGRHPAGRRSSRRWRSCARSWPRSSASPSSCVLLVRRPVRPAAAVRRRLQGHHDRSCARSSSAPPGSVYEEAVTEYADELDEYIDPAGLHQRRRRRGPAAGRRRRSTPSSSSRPTPSSTILGGERAEIQVLHEKLDPFQQTAIDIASRLAVQEVNAVGR